MASREPCVELGLRANWRPFAMLVLINAFVGAMVGQERTLLPLIAEQEFKLTTRTLILTFLISFGITKALVNFLAGFWADRWGRKPVLVAGWLVGLPVPVLLMVAPSWEWIVFANVLLGVQQGLCWTLTVMMKIDLVGRRQRGLAMGLNEFAGYLAVSVMALVTGYLASAYGLRPVPFLPGLALAIAGLILSLVSVPETQPCARLEQVQHADDHPHPGLLPVLVQVSGGDRQLFALSQAGMVNNLNDAAVWGLVPLLLAQAGASVEQIGLVSAFYPAVWGVMQIPLGALSDYWGRRGLIAAGMVVQAVGIWLLLSEQGLPVWLTGAGLLGLGTAMVYPTLLAAVADRTPPSWRATAVGGYRLWRDAGYAVGALVGGVVADLVGMRTALAFVAALTLLSGIWVAIALRGKR